MSNSVGPDQKTPTDLELHCLQRQGTMYIRIQQDQGYNT